MQNFSIGRHRTENCEFNMYRNKNRNKLKKPRSKKKNRHSWPLKSPKRRRPSRGVLKKSRKLSKRVPSHLLVAQVQPQDRASSQASQVCHQSVATDRLHLLSLTRSRSTMETQMMSRPVRNKSSRKSRMKGRRWPLRNPRLDKRSSSSTLAANKKRVKRRERQESREVCRLSTWVQRLTQRSRMPRGKTSTMDSGRLSRSKTTPNEQLQSH